MGDPTTSVVVRVLKATREVSHAASHLASVAADIARSGPDVALAEAATDCTLATARAAFRLDDALRKPTPDVSDVKVALDVLAQAEEAILAVRRALEQTMLAV